MKVHVNICTVNDLLHIPGVGEKMAKKIINVRPENPFTIDSLCDLLKKNRDDIEKFVTLELPQTQTGSRNDLANMKGSIALCNEKNASFSWDDTPPKHVSRHDPYMSVAALLFFWWPSRQFIQFLMMAIAVIDSIILVL
ncbi:hypothetical protein PoB_002483100 [Plakobranchus ocellatus]|uniref:Uncharacterized protein n=1 Tax=Plakobranchus ocellatus TaxID=259542 RepID=A0AAV3ZQT5_9GAST|nr:hypothetical protein PoB_002483100 [Plakobranchus ocellatus]